MTSIAWQGMSENFKYLAKVLDETATSYGMEISVGKTKVMTNNTKDISKEIKANGKKCGTARTFKYLGSTIADEGLKKWDTGQNCTAALTKLKPDWNDSNVSLSFDAWLTRSPLNIPLCMPIMDPHGRSREANPSISYKEHITNGIVHSTIQQAVGPYEELLTTIRKSRVKWYSHIFRFSGHTRTMLQGIVKGRRKRGWQKKRWEDNIKEWTGLDFAKFLRAVKNRKGWIIANSSVVPQRAKRLRDRWDERCHPVRICSRQQ